jgi:hypothetical protein
MVSNVLDFTSQVRKSYGVNDILKINVYPNFGKNYD